MRYFSKTAFLLLAAPVGVFAQSVHVVDPGQPGSFQTIQAGIQAALDGDVVLIRDGVYTESPLVDGRGIVLLGEQNVDVLGTLTIRQVPQTSSMVVAGLSVTGQPNRRKPALDVDACLGSLRVMDCQLTGSSDANDAQFARSGPGAAITLSQDVAIIDSQLAAGAPSSYAGLMLSQFYNGADGLEASGVRRLSLIRSVFHGGEGMTDIAYRGGDGGHGVQVTGLGTTHVAYSAFYGGLGGAGGLGSGTSSGDGGIGFFTESTAWDFEGVFFAGTEGCSFGSFCDPGEPGTPTGGVGTIRALDGFPVRLGAPLIVREGETFALEIDGLEGDAVRLVTGPRTSTTFRPRAKQPLLVALPAAMTFAPLGTIPSSMGLTLPQTAAAIPGANEAQVMWLQAQVESSSGQRALSSPRMIVVLAARL